MLYAVEKGRKGKLLKPSRQRPLVMFGDSQTYKEVIEMQAFNILLGYDDPEMLEGLGWALENKGYPVATVSSAEAVLKALTKKDFDLILMDLDLRRTNGIDLLHEVKELNPETMVIILCCKEDVTYSHDALRPDADEYIFKPCSKSKLWKRVANCLERLQLERSIASLQSSVGGTDERVLKILKIMLGEIQISVSQMKDILKQIKRGLFLHMDHDMAIKLRELDKIVTRLNRTVAELTVRIRKVKGDFTIEEKTPDWKEDVINPLLGNFPH
jgi:DNA-binding response OmpR family regulator